MPPHFTFPMLHTQIPHTHMYPIPTYPIPHTPYPHTSYPHTPYLIPHTSYPIPTYPYPIPHTHIPIPTYHIPIPHTPPYPHTSPYLHNLLCTHSHFIHIIGTRNMWTRHMWITLDPRTSQIRYHTTVAQRFMSLFYTLLHRLLHHGALPHTLPFAPGPDASR